VVRILFGGGGGLSAPLLGDGGPFGVLTPLFGDSGRLDRGRLSERGLGLASGMTIGARGALLSGIFLSSSIDISN